jgi:membrane protease YdiL (CAAX protease family)
VELYRNAGVRPLLWLAIVVAAPVAEEFIFRGFLFTGLRGLGLSGWRNLAAVVATAGVWAGIHFQYDAFGVASVFLGGLLLGYARLRTGSLWLCIVLHAIMNLVATVEVEVMLA